MTLAWSPVVRKNLVERTVSSEELPQKTQVDSHIFPSRYAHPVLFFDCPVEEMSVGYLFASHAPFGTGTETLTVYIVMHYIQQGTRNKVTKTRCYI